jgi:hypothetical protein
LEDHINNISLLITKNRASNMHYGLSRKEVMDAAYEFAKETSNNYPRSWDMNGRAGEQ